MSHYIEDWMHYLYQKHPNQRIILCPLVGAQLNKIVVNANPARQLMIDTGIREINNAVYQLNRLAKTSTPWICRPVHQTHSKSKNKDSYKEMSDGLHPDDTLLTKWATTLTNHVDSLKKKIIANGYLPN